MPSRYYGQYRFFFWVPDLINEPIHYHIEYDGKVAKFWLDPVSCDKTGGMNNSELRKIERVIRDNYSELRQF